MTPLARRLFAATCLLAPAAAQVDLPLARVVAGREVPLELDARRVAVRAPAADLPPALRPGAAGIRSAADGPLPGWSLLETDGEDAADVRATLALAPLGTYAAPVFVGADGGPVVFPPQVLVAFRGGIPAAAAEQLLVDVLDAEAWERDWAAEPGWYRVRTRARDGFGALAAANELARRPEVLFAEPDAIFTGRGSLTPDDPLFPTSWGLENTGLSGGTVDADMDASAAWDVTTGSSAITVVILDTGVQPDHPDLNLVTPGFDATGEGGDGAPVNACDNHGTPVAGCVSSVIDNGIGTAGIAPDCPSVSARTFISLLDCSGGWSSMASWTVDSLSFAESLGARVSNNSNFYGFTSAAIDAKYASTEAGGMVHYASAGNFAVAFVEYPASLPTVNAVAALDRTGALASFSSWGVGLEISAPGQEIWTADRTGADGYTSGDSVLASGTSFASPLTAGVAALVLSVDASLSADEVETRLATTAVDLGAPGYDTTYGWGFVNADAAVGDPPTVYCTAKPSSDGCLASMTTSDMFAQPVSGAADYTLIATQVQPFKNGLVFVAHTAPANIPFLGTGTLCMLPTLKRGATQNSGGSGFVPCDGTLSQLVNDGGNLDPGPGNAAYAQAWFRNPELQDGYDAALSNAVELMFQ